MHEEGCWVEHAWRGNNYAETRTQPNTPYMPRMFIPFVPFYFTYCATLHWWIGASSVSPYVITITWWLASDIIIHHWSIAYELFTVRWPHYKKNTLPWWYVRVTVGRVFCHACTSTTILWQNQDSHTCVVVEVFHGITKIIIMEVSTSMTIHRAS